MKFTTKIAFSDSNERKHSLSFLKTRIFVASNIEFLNLKY